MGARARNRLAAGIALVAGLVLLFPDSWISPRWQVALAGALCAACATGGAVALGRYLQQRDPSALFLALALGTLTTQAAVFGVLWPIAHEESTLFAVTVGSGTSPTLVPVGSSSTPVAAWELGLIVAGVCLVLQNPWWDRRGRPPVRPWLALAITAAVLAIGNAMVVALVTSDPAVTRLRPFAELPHETSGSIAPLAVVAALVFGVALRQELFGRRTRDHAWFAVALAAAIPMALSQIVSPTFGLASIQWADMLMLVVATSVFLGLLASLHLESSRMRRASDRADEVLSGRAEIAAMVAHDVRGPLGTMKGLATTIRKSYRQLGDEERLEFVGMIERESSRLLAQVDHIALALRVDARTLDLHVRRQALAPLIRQVVETQDFPPHPLTVDAPDDVSAPADAKWVPVAIAEGLTNAARYSPDEAPIHITLRATDADAVVEITDAGPGIPHDRREEVFQRFARWRPRGYEDRPGSGLGLFICRGIAREHGGDASLADGPAGGTILRIRLPLEGTGSE